MTLLLDRENGGCVYCDWGVKVFTDLDGRYHEVYDSKTAGTKVVRCAKPSATILPFRKPTKEGEAA